MLWRPCFPRPQHIAWGWVLVPVAPRLIQSPKVCRSRAPTPRPNHLLQPHRQPHPTFQVGGRGEQAIWPLMPGWRRIDPRVAVVSMRRSMSKRETSYSHCGSTAPGSPPLCMIVNSGSRLYERETHPRSSGPVQVMERVPWNERVEKRNKEGMKKEGWWLERLVVEGRDVDGWMGRSEGRRWGFIYVEERSCGHRRHVWFVPASRLSTTVRVRQRTVRFAVRPTTLRRTLTPHRSHRPLGAG